MTATPRRRGAATDGRVVGDALARFRGPIEQVPPAYAAIKRDGRPLYAYARAGEAIEVAPRAVVDPRARADRASAGPRTSRSTSTAPRGPTSARWRAISAASLGVGGHVTALRRTRSGPFSLAAGAAAGRDPGSARRPRGSAPLPARRPGRPRCAHLPQHAVDEATARDLRAGKRVAWEAATGGSTEPRVCLLRSGRRPDRRRRAAPGRAGQDAARLRRSQPARTNRRRKTVLTSQLTLTVELECRTFNHLKRKEES